MLSRHLSKFCSRTPCKSFGRKSQVNAFERSHSRAVTPVISHGPTRSKTVFPRPFNITPLGRRLYHDDPRVRNARPLLGNFTLRRVVRSPSTHAVVVVAVGAGLIFYFTNLETVPVSGRTRFNCYPLQWVREAGESQAKMIVYQMERQGARFLPDYDSRTRMVKRVMRKLIPFSGMADENWEVFVIDDPIVLPGGKVFVFSGILPIVRNDSGLAAVLGHEIAHNLADHAGERMSQSVGFNFLLYPIIFLGAAVGAAPILMQVFGSSVLDVAFGRPMSRLQESEADYIGLMMMAEACYDPREAGAFWTRMDQAQHMQPPEWLSTHPSNQARITKIEQWLPKAIDKYDSSDCRATTAFADLFKKAMERGIELDA